MDLQEHNWITGDDEKSRRVLDCLRRNDPALKELTLDMQRCTSALRRKVLLQALDAIATNSSLEILNIEGVTIFHLHSEMIDVRRALSRNTSLKDMRIVTSGWFTPALGIVMASPNLKSLTMRYDGIIMQYDAMFNQLSIGDITGIAQVLRMETKLQSLTIEGFGMDSNCGTAFAAAFQGNQTIKTLIMRGGAISPFGAVSFVAALPHTHSLEVIVFDDIIFNDDSAVRVVRTLCHTPLKVLSLAASGELNEISHHCCTRIVQTLKENEHGLTKLDLFRDFQHSPWQNFIRLEIDNLTWKNRLQVEKETWLDQFLAQDAPTQELFICDALERAINVDKERFSKAPNMLFYLIKEVPELIAHAIRDGQ